MKERILSEPQSEEQVQAEAEAETQGGRGRPRPESVVARDEQIWNYLAQQHTEDGQLAAKSREEVATATGLEGKQVYLSFYRLKRDGRIVKGGAAGAQKWTAVVPEEHPHHPRHHAHAG